MNLFGFLPPMRELDSHDIQVAWTWERIFHNISPNQELVSFQNCDDPLDSNALVFLAPRQYPAATQIGYMLDTYDTVSLLIEANGEVWATSDTQDTCIHMTLHDYKPEP